MNFEIIELNVKRSELEQVMYPKLRQAVFHYSSGGKFSKILECGYLAMSGGSDLKGTSIYSDKSAGKHLGAVCLFDLRNKTDEQIAPGKSYYDFMDPHPKITQAVYFVVSEAFLADVTTFDDLDDYTKKNTMYLPMIESWHKGNLPLNKLESIYLVNLAD